MKDSNHRADRARASAAALRELVEALQRRVPLVEWLGEVRIARHATALRKEAAKRVEELSPTQLAGQRRESERSDAVMTDDGGPLTTT